LHQIEHKIPLDLHSFKHTETPMNNQHPLQTLTTKRLQIRPLGLQDIADYFEIFGKSGNQPLRRFRTHHTGGGGHGMAETINNYQIPNHELELAVVETSSGKTIGILYFNPTQEPATIGYHFNESRHGMGYASEALTAWVAWLEKNKHKTLKALVHPENKASKRVLEKLGFHHHSTHTLPGTDTTEEVYLKKGLM
jgi:RimJ/RimL family protein N-acetyltransferase